MMDAGGRVLPHSSEPPTSSGREGLGPGLGPG